MSKLTVIAGVVVEYNNKVLLCKRSKHETLALTWSIPAGHREEDETPYQTANREFKEETNLDVSIKNLDLIGIMNKYNSEKVKKTIFYVFKFKTDKELKPNLKKAKDGDEHSECKYFKKNELPINEKNKNIMNIIKNN
jgi:ADP-ribose pyrophosphatase YjhB (NUDIX family)